MGIANDVISSVKVPRGLKVTLYEHDINWYNGGRTYVITADVPNLGNVWMNDVVSSIKVEYIG